MQNRKKNEAQGIRAWVWSSSVNPKASGLVRRSGKAHHTSDLFHADQLVHESLATLLYGKELIGLAISAEYFSISSPHRLNQARWGNPPAQPAINASQIHLQLIWRQDWSAHVQVNDEHLVFQLNIKKRRLASYEKFSFYISNKR